MQCIRWFEEDCRYTMDFPPVVEEFDSCYIGFNEFIILIIRLKHCLLQIMIMSVSSTTTTAERCLKSLVYLKDRLVHTV